MQQNLSSPKAGAFRKLKCSLLLAFHLNVFLGYLVDITIIHFYFQFCINVLYCNTLRERGVPQVNTLQLYLG
jgi:hypothetical protein